jgi:hypothetical protein
MTYAQSNIAPPTPEKMAAIAKYSDDNVKKGIVLMTGGLQRPTKGTHVKMADGAFSVTDGPFAETKELIDGFALIRADSLQHAIDIAREFMGIAGDGIGEILQVFDSADIPKPPAG